jgi:hypothetical protein
MHLRTVDDMTVKLAAYGVLPPEGYAKHVAETLAEADRAIISALAGTADVALDLALEP